MMDAIIIYDKYVVDPVKRYYSISRYHSGYILVE